MKTTSIIAIVATTLVGSSSLLQQVESFQSPSISVQETPLSSRCSTRLYEYVPSGFTPEQYKKFKEQEAKKKAKNLGRVGPKGFQSRSFQSFQEALEKGEASHLMPVFNAKEKIKSGKIRPEDVPYMQRGGSWDNTDIKNAKNKKKWLSSDKSYASGGFRKEQSVSILGMGEGLAEILVRIRKLHSKSGYKYYRPIRSM